MKRAFAVLSALILSSAAQAQEAPCLTRPQMDAVMAHMLPSALEGLNRRCAATLPADAYLRREGAALAARYRSEVRIPWSEARAGFAQMTDNALGGLLSESVERQMMVEIVQGLVAKEVETRDCARASLVIEQIAPLPIDNLGRLVTLIVGITGNKDDPKSPLRLCPGEVPAR